MAPSLIVTLLSQRPTSELEQARDQMRADIERLRVELQQVEDALTRQARRGSRSAGPARPAGNKTRILEVLAERGPTSTGDIRAALREQGVEPSHGTLHTTLGRLVQSHEIERIRQGMYQLASRNGSAPESNTGPTEIETTEPLLTATGSQERT